MISVVISSKDNRLYEKLLQNLSEKTKGSYEVIPIFNENGRYSICKAYNEGAAKSLGKYLVFLHEDVVIHTVGWDDFLIKNLSLNEIGLLGQAGAIYKSKKVSAWIDVPVNYYRSSIIQSLLIEQRKTSHQRIRRNTANNSLSDVVILDGMFLAMRKEIWQEFPFDEKTFNGFHCYDLDISMSIGSKYRVCVNHDILVEHMSSGSFGPEWYKESVKFHQKWRGSLPKIVTPVSTKERRKIEYHVLLKIIRRHLQLKTASNTAIVRLLLQAISYKPFTLYNLKLVKLLFKKYLKSNSSFV